MQTNSLLYKNAKGYQTRMAPENSEQTVAVATLQAGPDHDLSPSDAGLALVKVAVLIPCYNEESTVAQVVRQFRDRLPNASIYVFDNNSSYQTAARAPGRRNSPLRNAARQRLRHPVNVSTDRRRCLRNGGWRRNLSGGRRASPAGAG